MDNQTSRARSPSTGGQYTQNGGIHIPTATTGFTDAYDTGISPTTAPDQFSFTDQSGYLQPLNAPTFQQTNLSGGYQSECRGRAHDWRS